MHTLSNIGKVYVLYSRMVFSQWKKIACFGSSSHKIFVLPSHARYNRSKPTKPTDPLDKVYLSQIKI
jgi:hypothetical protein